MRFAIFMVAIATIIGLNLKPTSSDKASDKVRDELLKNAGTFAARVLQMDHRRRFMLPKGTIITVTPQITFPVFKNKMTKGGFQSDFQGSFVFYMRCDELGMTSDKHMLPFDVPPFYPFGSHMPTNAGKRGDKGQPDGGHGGHHGGAPPHFGFDPMRQAMPSQYPHDSIHLDLPDLPNIQYHSVVEESRGAGNHKNVEPVSSASSQEATLVNRYFDSSPNQFQNHDMPRQKRSVMSLPPPDSIHGGERAIILPSIESHLTSFGFDSGRYCMLRAICEVHELPLAKIGYGLIGEMITLFFSISESAYAESHMPEYLKAEKQGKLGDCSSYYQNCSKSIFKWEPKNSADSNNESPMDILKNFIPS